LAPLERRAITLEEVALRQPRLDEVFLALTGRAQPEAPADDQAGPAGAQVVEPERHVRERKVGNG
jgi:hypothetical protein